jgi:hypothetical protein
MKIAGSALLFFSTAISIALSAPASAVGVHERDQALSATINRAIRAGGPFFTPAERGVIERKCGYSPGQWDGYDVDIENGVFRCANGKRVDDAEMRALIQVAKPRIAARVTDVMARPEIRTAIQDQAIRAAREALANLARYSD